MFFSIKNQKDFWTGIMFIGFALAALWIGKDYAVGSASRMGPGYFPTVLCALLILFGVLALIRGVRVKAPPIKDVAWKAGAIVLLSMTAFGYLLERAGLPISLTVLILGSALASDKFHFNLRTAIFAVGLIVFCVIVFVPGLGLPIPLIGSWFSY